MKKRRILRKNRDEVRTREALGKLTECVRTGEGNLLERAVTAARSRATLGEISDALEQVYGRYQAKNRTVSGVYSSEIENSKIFKNVQKKSIQFMNRFWRSPRIMVAILGQDGHDRVAMVIVT